MLDISYILLFVDNPGASAAFYEALLDANPVESSPTFALFVFPSGLKLGLWSRRHAEPAPTGSSGSAEIAVALASNAAVETTYDAWRRKGVPIVQTPTEMDFGRTFVAADPDGHRIRVFHPNMR
ncbi:MAG: drug:proton antiporter [Rhizobiales bacterium 65-9]|nr:VOC family protein [Hyphomicrobiales bacterium]OJY32938.1 MAG: drug:proton antiporter [Rhizobiales bacterium 65-9]